MPLFDIFIIFVHNISYGHLKYPSIWDIFLFLFYNNFHAYECFGFFPSWIKEEKQQTKETHCQIPLQYDFLSSMFVIIYTVCIYVSFCCWYNCLIHWPLNMMFQIHTFLLLWAFLPPANTFLPSTFPEKKLVSEGNLKNLWNPCS